MRREEIMAHSVQNRIPENQNGKTNPSKDGVMYWLKSKNS